MLHNVYKKMSLEQVLGKSADNKLCELQLAFAPEAGNAMFTAYIHITIIFKGHLAVHGMGADS